MPSPLTIGSTPIKVVGINNKRYELFLQNVGKDDLYFKKQPLTGAIIEPSATNYDFILSAKDNKGETRIKIRSIASFRVVCVSPGASPSDGKLAYMETNVVNNGVC